MSSNNDAKQKPEFSARSADPNVMTSTDFSFVRKHWYVGIKSVALYAIFGIITSSFEVPYGLYWVFSGILLVLWVYFDYSDIYRLAMRDYNLVKCNYLEYDKLRGLKTGCLAQIPGLLFAVLMCVLSLGSGVWSDLFRVLWVILYSPFVTAVGAFQTMLGDASVWATLPFYLIPLLVQPVVGYLAYKNGYHNIGIFYKLIYKSRSKDKRLR